MSARHGSRLRVPAGRHRAGGQGAERSRGMAMTALVLMVTAAMGIVGTSSLPGLLDLERPFAAGSAAPSATPSAEPGRGVASAPASLLAAPTSAGDPHGLDPAWTQAAANPLTRMRLQGRIDCQVPLPTHRTDRRAELQTHLRALAACLTAQWQPVVEAAGLTFEPVRVVVAADEDGITTACGRPERAVPAVYCPAEHTIWVLPSLAGSRGDSRAWEEQRVLGVLAHEFGHHLQATTGLLETAAALPGATDAHEVTRRLETMATCLGALSQAQMDGDQIIRMGYHDRMADPATYVNDDEHGSARTQADWAARGFDSRGHADACSTFTAPLTQVS